MKKLISLLMVLCLLALCGCSGEDKIFKDFYGTWEFVGMADENDDFYGEEELGDDFFNIYSFIVIDKNKSMTYYCPADDEYYEEKLSVDEDVLYDEDGAVYLIEDEILFIYIEDDILLCYAKFSDSQNVDDVFALFEE